MSDDVLSGRELAEEWVDQIGLKYCPIQGTDGIWLGSSWVWCDVYMDFDYIQAWLLEVSSDGPMIDLYGKQHASQVADHLAVVWYPVTAGDAFDKGRRFDVQWRNQPHERWPGTPDSHAIGRAAWTWFAAWIEDWFEEHDRRASDTR